MNEYPKLHVEEADPPKPLPFPGRDAEGDETADGPTASELAHDALDRAQQALDQLEKIVDESAAAIPFPGRDADSDDDGPWAA